MPHYHNQRVYGARNTGCQNSRPETPGCRPQSPCPAQPSPCPAPSRCPDDDVPPCMSARPSCPINNCCGDDTNPCCSLAVAGVVNQKSDSPTYDLERAFITGTIYMELDKPFLGEGGCRR